MSGSHVYFIYRANPDAGVLSFNLDPTGQGSTSSTFTQVVAVLDDSANQMRLYVAGTSVGQLAIGASSDFTSNDDLGLAANAGQGGGGQESSLIAWNIPFHGDLAIIREYRLAFTETEATQNYLAVNVPEPAVSLLLFLVMLFHARRRQRLG